MIKKILTKTLLIFTLSSFCGLQAIEPCVPELVLTKEKVNEISESGSSEKGEVFVFFDHTSSMGGFVKDQPEQDNLYVKIVDDIQQLAENIGSNTIYQRFGSGINPMTDSEVSKVKTPDFYKCRGSSVQCSNQTSNIAEIFKIAEHEPDATHIIVTHLFLSDQQLVASPRKQITDSLRSVLKKGKSVGIIGIMNSFDGKIENIPTRTNTLMEYTEAISRPFYVIIIGNRENINRIKKEIEEKYFATSQDNYKYALITSTPIVQNLNLNKVIKVNDIPKISKKAEEFDFRYLDDYLPIYTFTASKRTKKVKLKIKRNDIIDPDSAGISKFSIDENVWTSNKIKCSNVNWKKANFGEISEIAKGTKKEFVIDLFKKKPLTKFFRGLRYFYYFDIYADEPGTASEEAFADWSIDSADIQDFTQSNPTIFKTLNLTKTISILNAVSSDTFNKTLIASVAIDFNLTK